MKEPRREPAAPQVPSTEEFDQNVDEEILDVISHGDFGRQQQILRKMAESVPEVSVARRIYGTLFPIMESNNNKAG